MLQGTAISVPVTPNKSGQSAGQPRKVLPQVLLEDEVTQLILWLLCALMVYSLFFCLRAQCEAMTIGWPPWHVKARENNFLKLPHESVTEQVKCAFSRPIYLPATTPVYSAVLLCSTAAVCSSTRET